MRVLITGGAGFIGSHIADAAIERGHRVLVLDSLRTGHRHNVPPAASFSQIDLRDASKVESCLSSFRPDVICHQAAQTSVTVSTRDVALDAEINVIGTINLLEAAALVGAPPVVFASTGGAIYGEVDKDGRASESTPADPRSPYACSKLAAEQYLSLYRHRYNAEVRVLRYANVYGPRQDPHGEAGVVAIFLDALVSGRELRIFARRELGDEGGFRDYVFVDDVVRANLAAIESRLPFDCMNVGSGVATSTLELARELARAFPTSPRLRFAERREGDLERSLLDDSRCRSLGRAVPLQEGLARTIEWYRDQNRSQSKDPAVTKAASSAGV